MTFFGEPKMEYSHDGGKTWDESPRIGEGIMMRVIAEDGTVLYKASAQHREQECDCCDGTGVRKIYRFVKNL